MSRPTVFVIDDDAAIREGVSALLAAARLPVECHDSAEAFLASVEPDRPGCLVLEVCLPGLSGLELQAELARRGAAMPMIFLTACGDIPKSLHAMKAGAADFLTKPVDGALLLERIKTVLARDRVRRDGEAVRQAMRTRLAALTEREREIFTFAISGLPNKEIARRLGISFRTVEVHRSHILLKTGALTLIELARLAAASGIDPASGSPPPTVRR